jgi:hypothetical protein
MDVQLNYCARGRASCRPVLVWNHRVRVSERQRGANYSAA